jgi:hypothetical protein
MERRNEMKEVQNRFVTVLWAAVFAILLLVGTNDPAQAQQSTSYLPQLARSFSADGLTVFNAVPPLVIVADPNPERQGIRAAGPTSAEALLVPQAAGSTFAVTYSAAGTQDPWGQVCEEFPAAAKTAFNAAGAVWAGKLQSSVPIKIKACWSDLTNIDPNILGYSGNTPIHRDFAGAPKANTWYVGSLANSLAKKDLNPASFDMYITYNSIFSWYYGTDGITPAGQYDLVTVATHEIGHGLNFMGTADYFGGWGDYGLDTYPSIYDTFMKSGAGQALITYSHPSTELGTLLTSNDLWFHGANAMAANGGTRVKIFAPSTWMGGSSYSHLDYETFAGTPNSLMVFAVGAGSSNHNPGPVAIGMLQDMGWKKAGAATNVPTPQSPSGNITDTTPTYTWTGVTGATQYRYKLMRGATLVYTKTVASSACTGTTCSATPARVLSRSTYKWKVRAKVGTVWKAFSPFETFTIVP